MEWSNTIVNEWCLMKIDKRIMLEIKIGSRVGSSYIHKYTHMHANTHTYIYIYIYIYKRNLKIKESKLRLKSMFNALKEFLKRIKKKLFIFLN